MPHYRVTWTLDVDADTPLAAALQAEDIQRNPTFRPCMEVQQLLVPGLSWVPRGQVIDLCEQGEPAPQGSNSSPASPEEVWVYLQPPCDSDVVRRVDCDEGQHVRVFAGPTEIYSQEGPTGSDWDPDASLEDFNHD